jgi:superfamily II DNA/RNA helicase
LTNAIIFCNRKREVAALHRSLVRHGFSAIALHGDMDQPARTAALDQFRKNEVTLLVASDVAARGLDIPAVSHIFNFDVPHHPDDYVHRIGRTGRAGRSGTAITIVAPADGKNVAAIEKLIGQTIPWMGKEPHTSAQELTEREHTERERAETGEHRKGDSRKDASPKRARHKRDHRNGGHREHKHERPARRDDVPAPVTRLDQVRPRRAGKPAHADEDTGGHLPAFLLRPFRVKA